MSPRVELERYDLQKVRLVDEHLGRSLVIGAVSSMPDGTYRAQTYEAKTEREGFATVEAATRAVVQLYLLDLDAKYRIDAFRYRRNAQLAREALEALLREEAADVAAGA